MRMSDPCPNVFSEVQSVAGNQQWWEYLHHGNLQPSPHLPPSTLQEDLFTCTHWNEEIIEVFVGLFFKWQSREHCPGDIKKEKPCSSGHGVRVQGHWDCRKGGAWWRRRGQKKSGALMKNSSILELCAQTPRESCQSLVKLGLEFKWESEKFH